MFQYTISTLWQWCIKSSSKYIGNFQITFKSFEINTKNQFQKFLKSVYSTDSSCKYLKKVFAQVFWVFLPSIRFGLLLLQVLLYVGAYRCYYWTFFHSLINEKKNKSKQLQVIKCLFVFYRYTTPCPKQTELSSDCCILSCVIPRSTAPFYISNRFISS